MSMLRAPTIHDVAERAGVSKSTVSLVVRGSPQVRAETRDRVRDAMVALGYVYNRAAAGLRGAVPGQVGLVVDALEDPHVGRLAGALHRELTDAGLSTLLAVVPAGQTLEAPLAGLRRQGAAGALVLARAGAQSAHPLGGGDADWPVVQVLNRRAPGPCVALDLDGGRQRALRWLAQRGARRLAVVSSGPPSGGRTSGGAGSCGAEPGKGFAEVAIGEWRDLFPEGAPALHLAGPRTAAFGRHCARHITWAAPDVDAVLCECATVARAFCDGRDTRAPGLSIACLAPWPDAPDAPARAGLDWDDAAVSELALGLLQDWWNSGRPSASPAPLSPCLRHC